MFLAAGWHFAFSGLVVLTNSRSNVSICDLYDGQHYRGISWKDQTFPETMNRFEEMGIGTGHSVLSGGSPSGMSGSEKLVAFHIIVQAEAFC